MARRARPAPPGLEPLERRCLLSGTPPGTSLFVRFDPPLADSVATAVFESLHARVVTQFPEGPTELALGSTADRDAAVLALRARSDVRYAEPEATIHIDAVPAGDPLLSKQWGLNNSNNVDIDAPEAWQITTGNPTTIVAVLDSGLDTSHPEFAGRLWTDPTTGVHGWNFLNNSPDIQDENGHGTHVAGILGATGNNGVGGAGVNWRARLMPLKFIGTDGDGSVDDAVRGIYFAVDHGARVINASWGGSDRDPALTDAIAYAGAHNVVFVTAAGNEGVNNGVTPSFPANVRLQNVLSVAAVDRSGNVPGFSNFGATTVDLAAPGVDIRSTVIGSYAVFSGTSMAAPFVSGVVSLVAGLHPEFTAVQLVQRVLSTTKALPSLTSKTITGGIVDAAKAVDDLHAPPIRATSTTATNAQQLYVVRWTISHTNPTSSHKHHRSQTGKHRAVAHSLAQPAPSQPLRQSWRHVDRRGTPAE